MPRPLYDVRRLAGRRRSSSSASSARSSSGAGPGAAGGRPASNIRSASSRSALSSACRSLAWIFLALVGANPITFDLPQKGTLQPARRHADPARIRGAALGLVTYTAAFIAEVVRAGILAGLEGPDGSRRVARPQARPDPAPRGHPAGDARHHPAADQPVPQPDQELVARGGDRLSRPRAGLHGHGAQPDRPGDRGGGDHHGGLPHHQPRHLVFMNIYNRRVAIVER